MSPDRINPMPGRLIVTEPHALSQDQTTSGGIILANLGENSRRSYGLLCEIVRTSNADMLPAGTHVFIPEFAGNPLVADNGEPLPYWFIGVGDVIAIVDDPTTLKVAV